MSDRESAAALADCRVQIGGLRNKMREIQASIEPEAVRFSYA